ncbi:MAG: NUDIX domain-containing protein [Elusimicrobiaceae bacterium]|nr:NUDIX domain-containing protein [Elusimicrobiaceae bacterium]
MPKYYSKLTERKVRQKKIYDGIISFYEDQVELINGQKASRVYTKHPGASAVVPITKEGKIIFVEQYRYPVGKITLEIPAGKLKPKQTPLACAKAELAEETGYCAAKFTKMLAFYPSTAFSTEVLHIYLAKDLKKGKQHLDEDEFVNTKELTLKQSLDYIKKGKIKDSKTIIALLYLKTFL